jgi:hypothetical protein
VAEHSDGISKQSNSSHEEPSELEPTDSQHSAGPPKMKAVPPELSIESEPPSL